MEFKQGGVHLPALGLWLDPHEPVTGPELAFVSHAHSDHIAAHREVILSQPTARLMQERMPGVRREHAPGFGQAIDFPGEGIPFRITLVPAGHVFGSAMSLVEAGGSSLLYTGDFKLRAGRSAEPCEPRHADILIMETTFGRPAYVFPDPAVVMQSVIRFCREALDNDETPVLLGYSLGKSQELLCGLGDAGFPIMLHGAIFQLTQIYQQFGHCFPPCERYQAGTARGKVLLCPPHVVHSAMLRNLGRTRTAILTGWAVDPNCRYRYQCDAAFPLSDHADFPDLLEFVKRVAPGKIWTLHGFAADFAQTLRERGWNAQALSENEQLALALGSGEAASAARDTSGGITSEESQAGEAHADEGASLDGDSFLRFCNCCEKIRASSSKLEKVRWLGDYLRTLNGAPLQWAAVWFTGRPFPPAENRVMQLGWAVIRDALCSAAGVDPSVFHQVYLKHSDLGEAAAEIVRSKRRGGTMRLEEVRKLFESLHAARGPLAKVPVLRGALGRCSASEAKFLVKIITGDLRIGLKEGLVEDSIAAGFARPVEQVRYAHLLVGDLGETALLAAEDRLTTASLVPFRPVKFMLASPEETPGDIWTRVVGEESKEDSEAPREKTTKQACVWIEDKYDGIRCQLHKVGSRVALYSRDLKDITSTFLDVVDTVEDAAGDFVLDGEILAMREDEVLPFAELQKRLGRRQGDLFMPEEVPITFMAFDLLWENGRSWMGRPLRERRARLEELGFPSGGVRLARITQARSREGIEEAFHAARARGNEGLMIKNPESAYMPGRRGLAWLKLKRPQATLDCVVIGAEYGHGKRSKVLSDYTFAVKDEQTGELKTIGKAYTGLTDAEIGSLTEHFLRTATRRQGRYFEVPPDTVLEIAFDKLQFSDRHSSGLAMRFPRIVRIRTDKSSADIDTVETARAMAGKRQNARGALKDRSPA